MFRRFRKKIGIIGYGNMGSAIAGRIKTKYKVFVFDKDKVKTGKLAGVKVVENIADLVGDSDVVVLAVKPQDFDALLHEIKDLVKDKLIISIAAGKTTGHIENILKGARVIRVMPNIGAQIGEAESTLCKGKDAKEKYLYFAKKLFNLIGKTWIIKEDEIDAVTAISGSGPAYIFYDMERNGIDPNKVPEEKMKDYIVRLSRAAKKVGLDSKMALELAVSTTASSIKLSVVSIAKNITPAELRLQVTSKGGTTEAALKVLESGGTWEEAAEAAKQRAEELSRG